MRSRHLKVFLTALAALPVCVIAQQLPGRNAKSSATASLILSSHNPAEGTTGTFSARVREVNVLFSASDWRGRFVSNLEASDVKVLDNGEQPQSLTYFLRQSDLPLRIGILVDVSPSVENVFAAQQRAAEIFLRQTLRLSDFASVMTFAGQSRVAQNFTGNLEALANAVHLLKAEESSTAIYDAVKASCHNLALSGDTSLGRRVLILITDGEDNSSTASIQDAINAALQSEVVIFALNTNFAPDSTDPVLRKLTENTGGRVLHASGSRELKMAFRKVNEQLRNQYLLGYKPVNWQADHSFHKIRVTTRRFGLHVHCRKGYYATE